MNNIIEDLDDFPTDMDYLHTGILKLSKWRRVQEVQPRYDDTGKPLGDTVYRDLRPGDNYVVARHARYNNLHMPVDDESMFMRRLKRKLAVKGVPVQWFERFADRGIDKVHQMMLVDKLR